MNVAMAPFTGGLLRRVSSRLRLVALAFHMSGVGGMLAHPVHAQRVRARTGFLRIMAVADVIWAVICAFLRCITVTHATVGLATRWAKAHPT